MVTPRGKQAAKGNAKTPPKSSFKTGKFTGKTPLKGKQDNRTGLNFMGLKPGAVAFWLKKHNSEEEPFFNYDYKLLADNPSIMEELGINAIVPRKGIDGETPRKLSTTSHYNWRQFLCIVGEDNNTPAKRKALAAKLVAHFNANANTCNYEYPRKVKFVHDLTGSTPRPADAALLDTDVIGLMLAAYEDTPIEEVSTFDDIMCHFWTSIAHGRDVVAAHVEATQAEDEPQAAADGGEDAEDEDGDGDENALADSESE